MTTTPNPPDWRGLCEELVEEVIARPLILDRALIDRARAALAQPEPEPEGPTDQELIAAYQSAYQPAWDRGEYYGCHIDGIRAVLARWGRPAPAPAEGEVAELVEWLELEAVDVDRDDYTFIYDSTRLRRAADLLRQRHPAPPDEGEVGELVAKLRRLSPLNPLGTADPTITRAAALLERLSAAALEVVPVPVSERLPGEEDCDAEGRCWLLTVEDEYPQWRLHSVEGHQPGGRMIWVPVDRTPGVMVDAFYASHWLPAQAIPHPAPQDGEVKA